MNDLDVSNEENQKEAPDINACLKECGFGKFYIKLLIIIMIGVIGDVAVTNTSSYLLPIAECDLNMTLLGKGLLNAATYSGMFISTILSGFLTDTFGRKIFVQLGYGGIFLFTILEGISQTYEVLIVAKFFEGLLYATSYNAALALSSELYHEGIRDRLLLVQASFTAVGQVVIAAISWAVLTQNWRYTAFDGRFVLHTWNFYLLIMSTWSLSAFIFYSICVPESPKFLISQKKYAEAKAVLTNIYKENTGQSGDTYPYKNIWTDEIETESPSRGVSFFNKIVTGLHNIKPMFRKPLAGYLIMISLSHFFSLSLYNIMRLWYPQLSTIVEHYSTNGNEDLCTMVDAYTADLRNRAVNVTTDECVPVKSGSETYINSMIIGSICILPLFITSSLVNKVGKKVLLVAGGCVCAAATLGIRWMRYKAFVVALFAIDQSVACMLISLNFAVIIQFFPTTTRTLAIAMVMTFSRLGTLFGNIAFPLMLDFKCEIPFFCLTGFMLGVIGISLLLPTKNR